MQTHQLPLRRSAAAPGEDRRDVARLDFRACSLGHFLVLAPDARECLPQIGICTRRIPKGRVENGFHETSVVLQIVIGLCRRHGAPDVEAIQQDFCQTCVADRRRLSQASACYNVCATSPGTALRCDFATVRAFNRMSATLQPFRQKGESARSFRRSTHRDVRNAHRDGCADGRGLDCKKIRQPGKPQGNAWLASIAA